MYRQYILKAFSGFFDNNKDMTVGQIMLSILNTRGNTYLSKSEWLMQASDEDFYTAIENAMEREEEI